MVERCYLCKGVILDKDPQISVLGEKAHRQCWNKWRIDAFKKIQQQLKPKPMTKDEAFRRLGPRAKSILASGRTIQSNGYRFTYQDYVSPPKPQAPPPATGHQNLRWTTNTGPTIRPDSFTGDTESENEPDIDLNKVMAVTPHLIMDTDVFEIITPYNTSFVRDLKSTYLSHERSYDFKRKVWTVNRTETNVNLAKQLIEKHFDLKPQMFSKNGDIQATYDTAVDVTSKYRILGVEENASQDEIKRAFRRIAKKLHGDVSDADEEFFILAKKAYDTLKDPRKRKRYDLARKLMSSKLERETGLRLNSRDLMT